MDDAGLHAANLASFQLVLARCGGWSYEVGDGWVAVDAASASRFFSFTVRTRDGVRPTPTVYDGRPGPTGWVEMDLWGRPGAPGDPTPVLMRRDPAPLPVDGRAVVARTPADLADAEQALRDGLELPDLHGVLLPGLLEHPVALAYDRGCQSVAVAFDDGASVGVYLVGTASPARGAGLAGAVTAAAVAALAPRPALLTSTTLGRPVYERLGFRPVGRATMRLRERDA